MKPKQLHQATRTVKAKTSMRNGWFLFKPHWDLSNGSPLRYQLKNFPVEWKKLWKLNTSHLTQKSFLERWVCTHTHFILHYTHMYLSIYLYIYIYIYTHTHTLSVCKPYCCCCCCCCCYYYYARHINGVWSGVRRQALSWNIAKPSDNSPQYLVWITVFIGPELFCDNESCLLLCSSLSSVVELAPMHPYIEPTLLPATYELWSISW
jgi:hypothetical protein